MSRGVIRPRPHGLQAGVFLLRQLLVFLMVVSMMPGVSELFENVEHIVHEGHFAHDEHAQDELHASAFDAEHGCTTLTHTCGCHLSMPAVSPAHAAQTEVRLAAVFDPGFVAYQTRLVSRANAPPVPPPTA